MTTEATEGTIAKEKIVQDFKTVYSDVEELLRATASQTGEKIGVIRERLQEHMHKAKDRLAETKDVVVDKTKQAARATDEPAAMMQFSNAMVFTPSVVSTLIVCGDANSPRPVTTCTLRCFANPDSPLVSLPTTPDFQARSLSISMAGLPKAMPV